MENKCSEILTVVDGNGGFAVKCSKEPRHEGMHEASEETLAYLVKRASEGRVESIVW